MQTTIFEDGDFIYLDPPYVPEKATSFTGYTSSGFDKHKKLFDICHTFGKYTRRVGDLSTSNKARFMMCNSDTELVRSSFSGYNIYQIECKRTINSKSPESKTDELIITNY